VELCRQEGPKYQYGTGCLSDQLLGEFEARVCGLDSLVDAPKVRTALGSVYQHNFKDDFSDHVNTQRPTYACGHEGGLILCSWPTATGVRYRSPTATKSGPASSTRSRAASSWPVWCRKGWQSSARFVPATTGGTGIHSTNTNAATGTPGPCLPTALLQALGGARYDAVDRVLHLQPALPGDCRSFLATATGYGTVGVKNGEPFVRVVSGTIDFRDIHYTPKT